MLGAMTEMRKAGNGRQGWKQDPAGVRANILAVAREEFAASGLSGARIDEIAAKTRTSKRMIYYYFTDKDGLYREVLEEAYREVRAGEEALELGDLKPIEALRRLVEFTFDHHSRNPDFIRLVMIENIHDARYLARSPGIKKVNKTAIDRLERIYGRDWRRASSGRGSSRSNCTGRSARSASSTSPTGRPSRGFSARR